MNLRVDQPNRLGEGFLATALGEVDGKAQRVAERAAAAKVEDRASNVLRGRTGVGVRERVIGASAPP